MVLLKFGIDKDEAEIEKLLNLKSEEGIDLAKIEEFLSSRGFKTEYCYDFKNFDDAVKRIYDFLSDGFVVIALVNRFIYDRKTPLIGKKVFWETDKFSLHYVVITGMDNSFIYFNDPHQDVGKTRLSKEKFTQAWSDLPWKFVFLAIKK